MNRVRLGMALVFLLGGLGMGASCRNNRTSGSGAAPRVEGDAEAAPSVAAPGALVTEVQGLDLAALSAAERVRSRRSWVAYRSMSAVSRARWF